MGTRYLIDTNVVSHLFSDSIPDKGKEFLKTVINAEFIISVVVEIEILTYTDTPEKMKLIEEFLSFATILPLDSLVTKKSIELRRKTKKLKLGDTIIAATCLVNNLTLITNNTKDFKSVNGLKYVDLLTMI
jgi:predicted nucleic acid-binding protein